MYQTNEAMYILYIKSLILFIVLNVYSYEEKLLHVHVIYRHGDRAPIELLPTGLNKTHLWINGLGELTDIGIRQHFRLGKYLIQRYNYFINKTYKYKETYVRSTDKNRTLMSAESNLAGMFHDQSNIIIPDLIWRPVPIHTIPYELDIVMNTRICPNYIAQIIKTIKSQRFLPQVQKFQGTLNLLRRVFHKPNMQFKSLNCIYDTLFCEKNHNITWDSWVTDEIYKNLSTYNDLIWKVSKYYLK